MSGKPICFAYNNDSGCTGGCGMVHCCQICLAGSNPKTKGHPACKHDDIMKKR